MNTPTLAFEHTGTMPPDLDHLIRHRAGLFMTRPRSEMVAEAGHDFSLADRALLLVAESRMRSPVLAIREAQTVLRLVRLLEDMARCHNLLQHGEAR